MAELSANKKSFVVYMRQSDLHAARGFDLLINSDAPEALFDELNGAGLFDPDKNPRPQPAEQVGFFRIPPWVALGYLTLVAKKAGGSNDVELGEKLMSVVRRITAYRDASGQAIDNYHTYSACAEIVGSVPMQCVRSEDLEMTEQWLSSRWGNDTVMTVLDKHIFQRFLAADVSESAKLLPALRHCTELRLDPSAVSESRKLRPIADEYWLEQLLAHNAAALGSKCGQPCIDCLLDRLRSLFADEYVSTHTWMFRAAIENHGQNAKWDHVTNAFTEGSRDALNAWILTGDTSAVRYVEEMLTNDAQIIRRVGINAVRENWEALSASFYSTIEPRLFDIGHLHELYLLLSEKFTSFSQPAQTRVLEAIGQLEDESTTDEDELKRIRYVQRNWLLALEGKGNAVADADLARLNALCGPVREHPDLLSYHTTKWGFGPSPFSKEELLAFARDQSLITRLTAFIPERTFGNSPLKSLNDALVGVVSEYPLEFLWTLDTSLAIDRRTQYGILAGLIQALDTKKQGAAKEQLEIVARLTPYAKAVAADESFWAEPALQPEVLEPTKDWIPPKLAELGKTLAANDEIPLSDSQKVMLLETSLSVLQHSDGIALSDDPMTSAINNTRGISFESLLQLLLRTCRDADAASGGHSTAWMPFAPILENELRGCTGQSFEVSTLIGCYFAQLLYVDEGWTTSKLDQIFPQEHPENFACAISGLSFTPVGAKVYEILLSANIPARALRMPQVKGSGRERLIERIAVAYSWDLESLDSEAMEFMFQESALDDLSELVSTVARWSSSSLQEDQRPRATALARKAVQFGMASPSTRQKILAESAKFIDYLPRISAEDMDWLLPAAPFASSYHGAYGFAESLDRLAAESPEETAQLLEAFLTQYQPGYDYQDRLQSVIRKLDSSGQRPVALRALDRLVRGGLRPFLELYEELVSRRLN
ncbi:hypothetical protein [Lysobacter sp. CFH 32150]|uniref:hypothetical protein n=1 Tax=Lysobacter sp. CFH 32150 TaxID=2927128 RepID=UPI001FA71ACC|nr:hypothetical protein [Lysobacter sp. CFH 32150]MCI4566701.1 hypothetical protein [Lysobacter sp. CFH 32150]